MPGCFLREPRLDSKGKLKVADRSCFYMRLNQGVALTEVDAGILEQVQGHAVALC